VRLDRGKVPAWSECHGDPANVFSCEEMLDNIMVYWLTATAASSARYYWESFASRTFDPVPVPVGCSIFPAEIYRPSRRWAQAQFPDLRYWNEPAVGGHFAAPGQPAIFVDEVQAAARRGGQRWRGPGRPPGGGRPGRAGPVSG
jgi:epoxide hydrolase